MSDREDLTAKGTGLTNRQYTHPLGCQGIWKSIFQMPSEKEDTMDLKELAPWCHLAQHTDEMRETARSVLRSWKNFRSLAPPILEPSCKRQKPLRPAMPQMTPLHLLDSQQRPTAENWVPVGSGCKWQK